MDFKKFEYDDLEGMEADELRELVQSFAEAHEANHETFKDVSDTVAEFNEQNEQLAEEVIEKTSLSEDAAESLSYSDKRSLLEDFRADDGSEETYDEDEGEEEEAEFEDRGTKGETHGEDGTPAAVEQAFNNISGVSLE